MKKLTSILVLSALCFTASPAFAQPGGQPPMDEEPGMGESVSDSLLTVAEIIMDQSCTCDGDIEAFTSCVHKTAKKILNNSRKLLKMGDESTADFKEEISILEDDVIGNCEAEDPVEEDPPVDDEPPA